MDQFWQIFLASLGVVVAGLATWISTALTGWLNSKVKDKNAAKHATTIVNIVMNSVQTVFQTYVDVLKKSGSFDEAAQKEAKEKAMTIIKSQLTPELKEYITSNFGEIESYLQTQIEAMIYQLKK